MNNELTESGVSKKGLNKAIAYGCRLLSVREYSSKLLEDKLKQKGYESSEVDSCVSYLLENNWLSDIRFCESFIRSRANRNQGLSRVKYELKQKGISNEMMHDCLEQLCIDWQAKCDLAANAKFKNINPDIKGKQKLVRFLTYRGFSSNEIQQSIKKCFTGVKSGEYDE